MKFATFSLPHESTTRLGAVVGDRVLDVAASVAVGAAPATLLELIQAGPTEWKRVANALRGAQGENFGHSLHDIRLHAPIPCPRKNVICLGLNYMSHAKETAAARGHEAKILEVPVFFTKAPTSVNGPFDPIPWDRSATEQVDWEVELGVIVGIGGKNLARDRSLAHVFGYTAINDVSARDLQTKHLQWFKGKSLGGFCPMGPFVVTADEFGDPQKKRVSLRVNGIVKQDATTAGMIFPVNVILEFLSRGMSLEPGDIIATGTPEGVGLGRTPPEYLRDGDIVETQVEGIGTMRNKIVAC